MMQHPRSLPDGQPDVRPVPDGRDKDLLRLTQVVAGVQQGIDAVAIPAPRFDLVEVTPSAWIGSSVSSSGQSLMTGWAAYRGQHRQAAGPSAAAVIRACIAAGARKIAVL